MDFGAGLAATLIGPDHVRVEGAAGGSRWGTVVVAASNTHQAGQDTADFVCAGAADQTVINSAIASLPTGGGRVLLLEGEYVVSGSITLTNSTQYEELVGLGWATKIRRSSGTLAVINTAGSGASKAIRDLRILGNGVDGGHGIDRTGGADECLIEKVHISGIVNCIKSQGPTTVVSKCYLAVLTGGTAVDASINSPRLMVHGCSIEGPGTGVYSELYARIQGNHFNANSIGVRTNGRFSSVVGNVFQSCTSASGALLTQGNDSVFAGNTFENSVLGINNQSARSVVANNTVEDSSSHGIKNVATHVVIIGNNVMRVNVAGATGIFLDVASDCLIANNYVLDVSQDGILLSGGLRNSVVGNRIQGVSQQTNLGFDGIRLTGNCDSTNVQGNKVWRSGAANLPRYGINVEAATCNDNLVTNNDLLLSGSTGSFNDAGTGTITVAGNRL